MRTALVIADSSWVVNDVRTALAVDPWEISELADPRSAAEVVSESEPDVVIIDMQVGSMGGMAVIRSIRARLQEGPLPRLVLLLDRSADRFLARRALADAAVLKPFGAADLRQAIDPTPLALSADSTAPHGESVDEEE